MTIILKVFLGGPTCLPSANAGDIRDMGQSLGQEDPLEKGMATHSSTLAWRIPWIEEPGELQGSQRVTKSQTQLKQLSISIILKTKIRGI